MSYQTTPGTIPHAAIEHLRKLPPGTKLSSAVLAEALDQPPSAMAAFLQTARENGLIVAEQFVGDRNLYWSLGTGESPSERPPLTVRKRSNRKPKLRAVPSPPAELSVEPQLVPETPPPPVVTAAPIAPPSARWGIFSDGELHIEKAGQRIVLERFEFETLVEFLERVHLGVAA